VTDVAGDGNGPLTLGVAVRVGLRALGNLAQVAEHVTDGRLEALLRSTLTHHGSLTAGTPIGAAPDPAVAVRAACAYLGAGEYEDAYLALHTALDFVRPTPTAHDEYPGLGGQA
jgi:hypothetical protein